MGAIVPWSIGLRPVAAENQEPEYFPDLLSFAPPCVRGRRGKTSSQPKKQ